MSLKTDLGAKRLEGTLWKANTPEPPARRWGGGGEFQIRFSGGVNAYPRYAKKIVGRLELRVGGKVIKPQQVRFSITIIVTYYHILWSCRLDYLCQTVSPNCYDRIT